MHGRCGLWTMRRAGRRSLQWCAELGSGCATVQTLRACMAAAICRLRTLLPGMLLPEQVCCEHNAVGCGAAH